jgi:hypothetical protein
MAKAVAKREISTVITPRMRQVAELVFPPLPEALEGKIDAQGWLRSVVLGAAYTEPDPDYIAREIGMQTLLAEDDREALMGAEIGGLQDFLEDYAGATTGPIDITDLYVATSDQAIGDGAFLIITWWSHEDGKEYRRTTGAQAIQYALMRYLLKGIWPIKCQFVRDKATDQGGKHILKVWPVDA